MGGGGCQDEVEGPFGAVALAPIISCSNLVGQGNASGNSN